MKDIDLLKYLLGKYCFKRWMILIAYAVFFSSWFLNIKCSLVFFIISVILSVILTKKLGKGIVEIIKIYLFLGIFTALIEIIFPVVLICEFLLKP